MAHSNETSALLVEDNDYYREEIKSLLAAAFPSLTIEEATEGREALEKLERSKPVVIFLDIALPGKNGLKLAREIKAAYPETVVAILTSYDALEYRQAAGASGADYFLVKDNVTSAEIIAIVEMVLNEHPER